METNATPTFSILGGDGKQYGPVTAEQFRAWCREGRADGRTQVLRSGTTEWVAAASLPELDVAETAPVAPPAEAPVAPATFAPVAAGPDPMLEKQVKNGVSWLYWIAGLSLVNSISALAGSDWRFIIGLGVTQFIDAFASEAGNGGKTVAFVLDAIAAGMLIALGYFANKLHGWAALTGMILLALDTGIVVLAALGTGEGSLWISAAFHAWAIAMIFRGFQAIRQLRRA